MKKYKIQLILNEEKLDKLDEVLSCYTDEGPYSSGWASKTLAALRVLVDRAIETKVEVEDAT